MKNYYIHGKITPTGFHLRVTLLKTPPKDYYCICEQISNSVHQAVRMTIEQCSLQPPKGREIQFGVQSSFLRE